MHPHESKSNRRRERRRRARQAWKNYAALEGLKLLIDNDMVTLYDFRTAVVRRSTRINISMSPARVIENPKLLMWSLDIDATAEASASGIARRIDHELAQAIIAGYQHKRAARAK